MSVVDLKSGSTELYCVAITTLPSDVLVEFKALELVDTNWKMHPCKSNSSKHEAMVDNHGKVCAMPGLIGYEVKLNPVVEKTSPKYSLCLMVIDPDVPNAGTLLGRIKEFFDTV